jgi:hypothetical protein
MFESILHRSPGKEEREIVITMTARKPVTLQYITPSGEAQLLAKETTTFKGVIAVEKEAMSLQWRFEGENIAARNKIRLEFG